MQSFGHFMDALTSASVDVAALAILLIFILPFIVFTVRAKSGRRFPLRPIRAYERLQSLVSQATESGRPIHVGLGSGQAGDVATPETVMGLTVFDFVARHAAASNQPILGTAGEATVLAAAQGVLQNARREAGFPERYTGRELNFYGPDPFGYAAGSLAAFERREHLASVLIGRFGAEGLWIAESSRDPEMTQLGGTSSPHAMALMGTALDETVIGEEIYAAGAYLHRPSHLGSLATQDVVRVVVILVILVGVVMTLLGYWG